MFLPHYNISHTTQKTTQKTPNNFFLTSKDAKQSAHENTHTREQDCNTSRDKRNKKQKTLTPLYTTTPQTTLLVLAGLSPEISPLFHSPPRRKELPFF